MDLSTAQDLTFRSIDLQVDRIVSKLNKMFKDKQMSQLLVEIDKNYMSCKHDPSFLFLAFEVYKKNEDLRSEYKVLKQLLEVEMNHKNQILFAECLYKMADYPAALKILHSVLDEVENHEPLLFDVYKIMGNIYLKCGDIEAAEEKYNLAHAIDSQNEVLIVNYGVLAIQKSDFLEAKSRFVTVLAKHPENDLAWVGLGLVHRHFGDMDLSRACLLRALDENPYNKVAITQFYQWSIQDGFDPSTEIIQHYMNRYPNDSEMEKLSLSLRQ